MHRALGISHHGDQCFGRDAGTRLEHDDRLDRLAPFVVGHADHGGGRNRRMPGEHILDFARKDVEAAGDDHVLAAIDDVEKTVGIASRKIAGIEPAVAKRFGRLLRLFPVAGHHQRAAAADFADLAIGHLIAVVIEQFDLKIADRSPAGGQPLGMVFRVVVDATQHRDAIRRFRLAIELHEHRAEALHAFDKARRRHRRGAVNDRLQAREVGGRDRRMIEQDIDHGRHKKSRRDAVLLDEVEKTLRIKGLAHHEQARAHHHRDDHRAGGVRDRRHRQEAHILRPVPFGQLGHHHRDLHAMGMHHAFGAAGRAAGVDQDAQIVGLCERDQRLRCEGLACGEDVLVVGPGAQAKDLLQAGYACFQGRAARSKGDRIDEEGLDARILEQVGMVVLGGERMHPGHAHAHQERSGGDHEGFRPVRRDRRHRIATFEPAGFKRLNEAAEPVAKLAIADLLIIEHEKRAIAAALNRADEQIAHCAAFMQFGGSTHAGSEISIRLRSGSRR